MTGMYVYALIFGDAMHLHKDAELGAILPY